MEHDWVLCKLVQVWNALDEYATVCGNARELAIAHETMHTEQWVCIVACGNELGCGLADYARGVIARVRGEVLREVAVGGEGRSDVDNGI